MNGLKLPFLLSAFAHLVLAIFLSQVRTPTPPQGSAVGMTEESPESFEIVQVSPAQMNRYRQAGVRGGSRDGFNAPVSVEAPKAPKAQPAENQAAGEASKESGLQLGQLAPTAKPIAPAAKMEKPLADTPAAIRLRHQDQTDRIRRQQQQIQGSILREMQMSPENAEIIKATGFNIQFDPPEGIPEDELNSVEKIFYSFQRRTFQNYVSNFISNYQTMIFQKPHVKKNLEGESHHLIGRVEFDEDGYVVGLKLTRTTEYDDINMMFETTLKNLQLPNPPVDLLNTSRRLVIYYQLKLN